MVNLYFFIEDESLKDKLNDMIKENDFSLYRWQKKLVPEHIYERNNNIIHHVVDSTTDSTSSDVKDGCLEDLETYYMKNMKIRYLLRKFVCIVKTKIAKRRIIGKEDLRTFETIKEDDAIDIICHKSKTLFRFHVFSLISTFRISLYYQTWGRPEPQAPKNPFNNLPWTYTQNIEIIKQIQEKLSKKYQHLPKFLCAFAEANYDIHTYQTKNLLTLAMIAVKSLLDDKAKNSDGSIIRDETLNDMFDMLDSEYDGAIARLIKQRKLSEALQNEWEQLVYNSWLYTNYAYAPDYYWKDYESHSSSVVAAFNRAKRYVARMNATETNDHSAYTRSLFQHLLSTMNTSTIQAPIQAPIQTPIQAPIPTMPLFAPALTSPPSLPYQSGTGLIQSVLASVLNSPIQPLPIVPASSALEQLPPMAPLVPLPPIPTNETNIISHFSSPINLREILGYTIYNNSGHVRVVINNGHATIYDSDVKEDEEDAYETNDENEEEHEEEIETGQHVTEEENEENNNNSNENSED
jgi:hypothetical protein